MTGRPADGRWAVGQVIGYREDLGDAEARFRVTAVHLDVVSLVGIAARNPGEWPDGRTFPNNRLDDYMWMIYEEGTDDPNGIP